VREQQVFQKNHAGFLFTRFDAHRQGETRQAGVRCPAVAIEGHGHQAWARFHQPQTELLRNAVAEVGGADLGDGQATGGHHHRAAVHGALIGVELVNAITGPVHGLHAARLPALHAARLALAQQHLDQVFGRAVTES
jgi:hypothetical protein